jgi:hypothetical protein
MRMTTPTATVHFFQRTSPKFNDFARRASWRQPGQRINSRPTIDFFWRHSEARIRRFNTKVAISVVFERTAGVIGLTIAPRRLPYYGVAYKPEAGVFRELSAT